MHILHALRVPAQQRSKHVSGYHPRGTNTMKGWGDVGARSETFRDVAECDVDISRQSRTLLPRSICHRSALPTTFPFRFHSKRTNFKGEKYASLLSLKSIPRACENNYYTNSINKIESLYANRQFKILSSRRNNTVFSRKNLKNSRI